jgi:3-oxoacid CoA-transferase
VILQEHTDKKGNPKILAGKILFFSNLLQNTTLTLFSDCTFPLTGPRCVSTIITDLAVFDVSTTEGLTLIEHAEGVTVEEIRSKTAAPFKVSEDLKPMQL